MRYILIAYKQDWDQVAMSNVIGHDASKFELLRNLDEAQLIDEIAKRRAEVNPRDRDEPCWEFYWLVEDFVAQEGDGHIGDEARRRESHFRELFLQRKLADENDRDLKDAANVEEKDRALLRRLADKYPDEVTKV